MNVEQNGKKYRVDSAISWLKNLHTSTEIEGEEFCKQCSCRQPCPTQVLIIAIEQLLNLEKVADEKPKHLIDVIGNWLSKNGFERVTHFDLSADWETQEVRMSLERLFDDPDEVFELEHIPLQEKTE